MTTILAVQGHGWSVIACDSRVTYESGRSLDLSADTPKVCTRGEYVLGAAGDVRAINILSHAFDPPKLTSRSRRTLDNFMTSVFIPSLRQCFEEHGYAPREAKDQASIASVVIVSVAGAVYEIDEDYSWSRSTLGLYAAGSGGDYALGAMKALLSTASADDIGIETVEVLVFSAIKVAAALDVYSGGEVKVVRQYA